MSENTSFCPVCGSGNVKEVSKAIAVKAPFGPEVEKTEALIECADCGFVLDVESNNDQQFEIAYRESAMQSIVTMISKLEDKGYSMAAIERALELPWRTLSRWKSGKGISAVGLALLRTLATYPWILEVAEQKFDPMAAGKIMCMQAYDVFTSLAQSSGFAVSSGLDDCSDGSYEIHTIFRKLSDDHEALESHAEKYVVTMGDDEVPAIGGISNAVA